MVPGLSINNTVTAVTVNGVYYILCETDMFAGKFSAVWKELSRGEASCPVSTEEASHWGFSFLAEKERSDSLWGQSLTVSRSYRAALGQAGAGRRECSAQKD